MEREGIRGGITWIERRDEVYISVYPQSLKSSHRHTSRSQIRREIFRYGKGINMVGRRKKEKDEQEQEGE